MPSDLISFEIAFNGFYDLKLTNYILKYAKKGGLFIDIGANMGYFTLLWLANNTTNKSISIEASPKVFDLLANNIKHSSFCDRSQILNKAAGNENKSVRFDIGSSEQTGWGGVSYDNDVTDSIEVEMIRLDELVTTYIDVLKIDVEGADTLVLHGCEKLLQKRMIGVIFFEQNDTRMKQLALKDGEAQQFLERNGYECRRISPDEWMAMPSTHSV